MRLTTLCGGGAYPTPERGCSGYLVEQDGFHLLLDPGYGSAAALLAVMPADQVDAVFVTHGHADHCADLNPLLRIRHLTPGPTVALPVFALAGSVDAVLSLDGPMLDGEDELHEIAAGDELTLGPFQLTTRALQHFVPNVGVRVEAGGSSLAYTGDGGGDPAVVDLADGVTILLAEASFADDVPSESAGNLSSGRLAGECARRAAVGQLVLTHLMPGIRPQDTLLAARRTFDGPVSVATPGASLDLG